ncbi:hypothetical protein [uncultured Gammaproteobacteria bacterium]|nr:hypothetical protein [uncultured Gammaproteobacteria bacterium]
MSEKITNLSKFIPKGALGQLFQQARALNHLNEQLSEHLPEQFALLSLCTIKDNTATFVTDNQAIIFRAQKQNTVLLSAIKQVKSLTHIEKVVIKIDLKRPLHK